MSGPEILHRGGTSYTLLLDGQEQSLVDLDDPTRLAFDYVRRLGDALDLCFPEGQRLRVTHVGGAAMTLPRYVAATRPTSAQIVIEPDERVVELTREELPLPARSGIKVRVTDGRAGIVALPDGRQDAVVVDAFADGRVPGDLVTAELLDHLARALAPEGVAMLNVIDRAPFTWSRRVVAGLRRHLDHVVVSAEPSTWKARRGGNLVILASRHPLPADALRRRAESRGQATRVLDERQVRDTLGGGLPFERAEDSPAP